jgi:hypothetical protein
LSDPYSSISAPTEHKMIDIQCEIQKLQADLEYHEQKIRLINHELTKKTRILSNLLKSTERFRKLREKHRDDD